MFGKWLKEQKPCTTAYELKIEKGKAFAFNKVKDHQVDALLEVKYGGLYHKIADNPIYAGKKTRFHIKKPFDCIYIRADAYIVLWFYVPRTPKVAYLIDIDTFGDIRTAHPRKSIRQDELDVYVDRIEHTIRKVKFA